jgi:23S rRNA (guanosine2251-2'-O)-methyltransferase
VKSHESKRPHQSEPQQGQGSQTIYGLHAVRTMLVRHPERVTAVRLAEQREDPRAREIDDLARQKQIPVHRVDAQVLKQKLGEAAHQGVVADIRPLPPWSEDDLLAALQAVAEGGQAPLLLALDGVQDPHNLGACLRTADACGALAVVVPRDRAAHVTPVVRKVAVGAAETTPVVTVTNLVRTLKLLKEAGLWVIGADAGAIKRAHDVDLKGGVVLVLGAEGAGLRHLTAQTCDWMVRLPQLGAVESLNVSVAAGMLLYEAVRQRGG